MHIRIEEKIPRRHSSSYLRDPELLELDEKSSLILFDEGIRRVAESEEMGHRED